MNKLKEDIRRILSHEELEEFDPWNYTEPPKVSQEEIDQSIEKLTRPKPPPVWRLNLMLVFLTIWGLGHLIFLYAGAGAPWAVGMFFILLVNLVFLLHYGYLLLKERANRRIKN